MTLHELQQKREGGFTLVELAIVMIIIGLLIGGILKGQELIANSQVTATIAQIKGYDAAMTTFRDKYNAIPGDMGNAQTRLPNCTTTNECRNAPTANDNNGRIDVNPGAASGNMSTEASQAFVHMAFANLISGVESLLSLSRFNLVSCAESLAVRGIT